MVVQKIQLRRGVYYDSLMLMQAQRRLLELPGVIDATILLGTKANKAMLTERKLAFSDLDQVSSDDLIIVVSAQDEQTAANALDHVDEILTATDYIVDQELQPKSLKTAVHQMPGAQWVLISVAGRYAADVAREALRLDKNVFLFSDNVTIEDEIELKQTARDKGLLVLGPDCGTTWINGVGLGFANSVRNGPIGVVAASGTGLQYLGARLHQQGSGISHGLGIGSRDPSEEVGGVMANQCLNLLARDEETRVIVLMFKPPSHAVADKLLGIARSISKPIIAYIIGYSGRSTGNIHFVKSLDEAADLSIELATAGPKKHEFNHNEVLSLKPNQKYIRGLFSGGTLAYEMLSLLSPHLLGISSNVPISNVTRLQDVMVSQGHTVLDLGDDEFTVGKLHPMLDNELRIKRLLQEADDPQTAIILLDVVLGHGAHPDPASELAPAIALARTKAANSGRTVEVITLLVGTDDDPQDLTRQITALTKAGARVETCSSEAASYVLHLLEAIDPIHNGVAGRNDFPVDMLDLHSPLYAINVGLPIFTQSLQEQEVRVLQVDWKPPAGGNERLLGLLEKLNRE